LLGFQAVNAGFRIAEANTSREKTAIVTNLVGGLAAGALFVFFVGTPTGWLG